MTERFATTLLAAALALAATPLSAAPLPSPLSSLDAVNDCSGELKIVTAAPLTFGIISVEADLGGVVIVSPTSAVATLGGVAVGPDAAPAIIHLCGPPDTEFLMQVEPGEQEMLGTNPEGRPNMVRGLEATANGAELHPTGDGQWQGTLGARGDAEIRIGGSLTIPARQKPGTFTAPFRLRIDPLN